jgi:hypothetical protein
VSLPLLPRDGVLIPVGPFLGGFVAAEGCFTRTQRRFRFAICVAAADADTAGLFRTVLGVGRLHRFARRRAHYDDEAIFAVQRTRDLVEVVVPFMNAHLPRQSHKWLQYLSWREALLDHWLTTRLTPRSRARRGSRQ